MLFIVTGCKTEDINDLSIDELLNISINTEIKSKNVYNIGYKYYIPKGFRIHEKKLYNQTLVSNGKKYYLNVDKISYYNKITPFHNIKDDSYYYKSFDANEKEGYIELIKNNDYFFIEIMYNYAIIEVAVTESEINYSVINMLNILNSIVYNDSVISKEISGKINIQKENIYEIEKPKVETDDKNFLDYVEKYDKYDNEIQNKPKDEDKITE